MVSHGGWIGPRGPVPAPDSAFLGQQDTGGLSGAAGLGLLGFMAIGALAAVLTMRSRGDLGAGALRKRLDGADGLSPVGWMAGGMALWLIWQLAGAAAAQNLPAPMPGEPAQSLERATRVMLPAYAVGVGAAGLIFAALRPRLVRAGFRIRPLDPLVGVGLLLVVYPFVYVVGDLSVRAATALARAGWMAPPDGPAHETLRMLVDEGTFSPVWWTTTLMVVFAAPLLEELIHRGFLQTAFGHATGRPWAGIVLSSVVFALIHMGAAPVYALPGLFALSLGLGWAFERTRRLAVPVAMHGAFNALNIIAATVV